MKIPIAIILAALILSGAGCGTQPKSGAAPNGYPGTKPYVSPNSPPPAY